MLLQACHVLLFTILIQMVALNAGFEGQQSRPLILQEDRSTISISLSADVRVEVEKTPWGMTFYDSKTNQTIAEEARTEYLKTGFGKWKGRYLHIYEGYLLRVGEMVEWYDVTNLISYKLGSTDIIFYIGTTDKERNRTLSVHLYDVRDRQFSFTFLVNDTTNCNRISWPLFIRDENEGFYGFGERFTQSNQRGRRVSNWLEEGSWAVGQLFPNIRVPKGAESTYMPMPLFFSSKGYGLQLDTFYRSVFDNEFRNDVMYITTESNVMSGTIFARKTVKESFRMMVERNGKSLIPPAWALDSEVPGGTNLTDRAKELLFDLDIPISTVINPLHFFPAGGDRGPQPEVLQQNEYLLSLGLPTTAYFNPMVDQRWTQGYAYAAGKGFFVRNQQGQPYNFSYIAASDFFVSQVDFTNPDAVTWYQGELQHAMDLGFRGWMYDFGEYTPPDSVSADGSSGLEVHNRYPLLYQKACFDHLVKTKDNPNSPYAPDYLFYVRSGYLGTQAVTWAHWTGDPSSDWSETSGLPAQLTAMLNVGISGIPFSGSDIGGFEWYTSPPPDEELWVRWTQLGAFSGYMHEQGGGKGFGRKPHIFDSINGTRLWRKFAKLRTQLFPYIYTQAHTANQVGLPIMRHHILDFDDDNQAISKQYQYMFGDKLLVAPVYKSGVSEREVYLPNNSSWIDISSHLLYDEEDGRFRIGHSDIQLGGKSLIVAASLETCPFFVRAGSIIPLLDPSVLVLREASHPNVTSLYNKTTLHLWVFPDVFKNADGSDWQNNSFAFRNSSVQSNLFTYGMNLRSTQYTWIVSQILLSERPHDLLIEGGVVKSVLSWTQVIPSGADPIGVWSYDQQQRVLWIGSANTVSNITIAVPYISL